MNHWLFWSLLSALFAGLTAVLAKVGVTGVDATLATALRTTVILGFTWLLVWVRSARGAVGELAANPSRFAGLNRQAVLFLVLSGLATGLSWLCYFRALQLGEASRVVPVDKLSVLFVIVFAAIWLKEPVGWQNWVGGTLILAGAIVLAWKS